MGFNPNSIGKNPKRQKILNEMRKKGADIIMFSDTRIAKEIEPTVIAEWGGKINFASYTSQARGVAIFFRKELPIEIIEDTIYNDNSGNFTCLNVKFEEYVINLSCIYGPNEDNPQFYENIVLKQIETHQESSDFVILGGDLNLVMSQDLDTFGYTAEHNVNAKTKLKEGMENLGLVDVFREFHPDKKRFSWRQFGGNKRARLDLFIISATLLPFIEQTDILPGISSDHSITTLEIDFSKFSRGRGFFKFNNSLLKDSEYATIVTEAIREVATKYAEDVYEENFLKSANPEQLQNLFYYINPQLLMECILLEIRGKSIEYCARKKKLKNQTQYLAIHRLEIAETSSDNDPSNTDLKAELIKAKAEVEEFAKQDLEGSLCRARTKWQVDGEKPSKFFCNLEKYNALQKYIPELKVRNDNNEEVTVKDQKSVDRELLKFYQNLYRSQENKLQTNRALT